MWSRLRLVGELNPCIIRAKRKSFQSGLNVCSQEKDCNNLAVSCFGDSTSVNSQHIVWRMLNEMALRRAEHTGGGGVGMFQRRAVQSET